MDKKKFNVLDLVIITVIVLSVAALAVRYISAWKVDGKEMAKYAVSISVKNVRSTIADAFVAGDEVFLESNSAKIGTIESLDSSRPASAYASDLNGGIVKLYYPENTKVDISATITCVGIMNEKGFFSDGTQFLSPGMDITIYTSHMYVKASITSITKIPE